jgi:hypothetical protein
MGERVVIDAGSGAVSRSADVKASKSLSAS